MKARINNSSNVHLPATGTEIYLNPEITNDIRLVDFVRDPQKGQIIIFLSSLLFSDDNVKILIHDSRMVVIVTETVKNLYSSRDFITDWQRYTQHSYERIHNINIILPGDDFYLLRHFVLPEKYLLKVILGQKA